MSDGNPIIVKKKKVQPAAHHGGSWKVAYADFVTAMMAFFMVMWIMGMSQETRSMVAGYFNDPLGFMKNPPKSRSPFAIKGSPNPKPGTSNGPSDSKTAQEQVEMKKIETEFKEALSAGDIDIKELSKHIEVSLDNDGLRIEFQESAGAVFFESGQTQIRAQALRLVENIAPVIIKSGRLVNLEGHTDASQYSGAGYDNWDLSNGRALAFKRALMSCGMPYKQFNSVSGYADTRLKNKENPLHFSNRRVTMLLPFTKSIQISDNLPKDQLKTEIQGIFNKTVGVAPPPNLAPVNPEEANAFGQRPAVK